MTLRQLWVRFQALPPEAPVLAAIRADLERDGLDRQAQELDDTLDLIR